MRASPLVFLISTAVVTVSLLSILSAQQATAQREPLIRENATEKISPHVYWIADNDVPQVSNIGIVVGDRATLVIDTGLGARNGETVAREAAKVSRATALLKGANFRRTDISFDRAYRLNLGGVHVRMTAEGPAHTRGDTVFFVEEDGVLFTGDVVMPAFPAFQSPYSSLRSWAAALDRLDAMKPSIIVPSHGRKGDASMIAAYRDYFRTLQTRVSELKAQGKSPADAAKTMQTEMPIRFPGLAYRGVNRVTLAAQTAYNETP